jgi:hypothetical protein
LKRIFTLFSTELEVDLDTMVIQKSLDRLFSKREEPSKEVCKELCKDVEKIRMKYVRSEIPALPNWLRPKKV